MDQPTRRVFSERFRHHFVANEHTAPLFDGAQPLLAALEERGALLAVATGKSRRGLQRALESTGVGSYFVTTRCADEGFPKPHPDMIDRILSTTGVDRERAIMIGDTTHDLNLAANAGIDAVAVTYGAHPVDALAALQPRFVASDIADLRQWLMRATVAGNEVSAP